MWLNKNFISGQVLNASDLNSIVKGLNDIEYKIPNTSINNIREEQNKLNGTIQNVKNTITNIQNTISQYNIEELKSGITQLQSSVNNYVKDLEQAKKDISNITGDFESNVETIVDEKTASIIDKVQTIDGIEKRVIDAEVWINGTTASITSMVKNVDALNDKVTLVKTGLDGVNGNYKVLASRVTENETNISSITVEVNSIKNQVLSGSGTDQDPYKISSTAIDTDSIISTVQSAVVSDINEAKSNANDALAAANKASEDVSIQYTTIQQLDNSVTMIADAGTIDGGVWTPTVNPATIVAAITEDDDQTLKSDIMLSADTITLVGDTVVENLNAMDLTVGGGSTVFNKDGSGHTANGNISWTEDGLTNQMYMSNVNGLRISLPGFNSSIYESEDEDDYIITCENITFSTRYGYVEGICIVLKSDENIKVVFIDKYGKRTVFKRNISNFTEDYEEDSEIFGKISNKTIYLFFRNKNSIYGTSVGYITLGCVRNNSNTYSISYLCGKPSFVVTTSYPQSIHNIPAIIEYEGFVYFIQQTSSNVQIIKTDNNYAYVYRKSFVINSNIKMMSDKIGIIGGNTIVVPVLNSSNKLSLYWLGLYNLQNQNFTLSEWDNAPEITGSTSNTFFINGDALINPSDEGRIAMICCQNKCYPIIEKVSSYGPLVANWTASNQNNYMFTENSFSNMSFKNQIEYLQSSDYTFLNSDPFLYSRKDTKMHKGNNTVKGLFLNSDGQPMAYTEEDVLVCDGDQIDLIDLICSKLM